MKNFLVLAALILSAAFASSVDAQQAAPPGAGDKDLRDTNVKQRSVEMERIDREAKKEEEANKDRKKNKSKKKSATVENTPAPEPPKDALAETYPQIKEDYEAMQNSQAAIMNAYGDGKAIDYAKISSLSTEISKNAARLNLNLFPAPPVADVKTDEKKETDKPITGKSLRSLLIELDEAVAAVIASPIFQNLRTVEPAVGEKAKADLRQIVRLTEAVNVETAKNSAHK